MAWKSHELQEVRITFAQFDNLTQAQVNNAVPTESYGVGALSHYNAILWREDLLHYETKDILDRCN